MSTTNNSDLSDFLEINNLLEKINSSNLPPELAVKATNMIKMAQMSLKYSGQFLALESVTKYIDWITKLPWKTVSQDRLDLKQAKEILDKHHYGLEELKDRILEYLAVLKLKKQSMSKSTELMRAPILCFVGLVGTGKTTIAKAIAEAMGRQFIRIPFGGMGSATVLRGQSRVHPESEPGQIIKALNRAGTKNPVILLDELDRVAEQARADIMGVLVELLDPEQNVAFLDYYIDFPFDLSQVLFITTANNTTHISTAVLDRLEPLQMPSYTDEEKIIIGKQYMLPKIMRNSGLGQHQLKIADDVWPTIVRPLGYDAGMRSLERTINSLCRKVARMIVEGKAETVTITNDNVKSFIKTW